MARNPYNCPQGYVYVLRCGKSSYYKIGKTASPKLENRLGILQVGCPYPHILIFSKYCKDAYKQELQIHKKYWHYRIRGEWFELTKNHIQEIIDSFD